MASPFRYNKNERRRWRPQELVLDLAPKLEEINPEIAAYVMRGAELYVQIANAKRRKTKSKTPN
jgi:hypothetical protein